MREANHITSELEDFVIWVIGRQRGGDYRSAHEVSGRIEKSPGQCVAPALHFIAFRSCREHK